MIYISDAYICEIKQEYCILQLLIFFQRPPPIFKYGDFRNKPVSRTLIPIECNYLPVCFMFRLLSFAPKLHACFEFTVKILVKFLLN